MKHARIDENQATLIKRVKIQNEKKPELNLLSMQSVGFQKTFIKFIENFVPARIISLQEKNRSGNHLSDHH